MLQGIQLNVLETSTNQQEMIAVTLEVPCPPTNGSVEIGKIFETALVVLNVLFRVTEKLLVQSWYVSPCDESYDGLSVRMSWLPCCHLHKICRDTDVFSQIEDRR